MHYFLKKVLLFFSYFFLLSLIGGSIFIYVNNYSLKYFPAPNFSNSISFNEKVAFLKKRNNQIEILANGSSMSLNNLHSKTIAKRLESNAYLNASSWGMSIKDNFLFMKTLVDVYHPKKLIIVSNIIDFQQAEKIIDFQVVTKYLKSQKKSSLSSHLELFNLKHYIQSFGKTKIARTNKNDFASLIFDSWGGVTLANNILMTDSSRWNDDFLADKVIPYQYSYLDSISSFCKSYDIKLYFVQSPLRKGLFTGLNKRKSESLSEHTGKIKKIVESGKHCFVDGNSIMWDDDLFADAIHFNEKGAILFTNYLFDQIKMQSK